MINKVKIYTLEHPLTGEIRYDRLASHLSH